MTQNPGTRSKHIKNYLFGLLLPLAIYLSGFYILFNMDFFFLPIKNFQKHFMAHQLMPKIFHDPWKNPLAPSPTYLNQGQEFEKLTINSF